MNMAIAPTSVWVGLALVDIGPCAVRVPVPYCRNEEIWAGIGSRGLYGVRRALAVDRVPYGGRETLPNALPCQGFASSGSFDDHTGIYPEIALAGPVSSVTFLVLCECIFSES